MGAQRKGRLQGGVCVVTDGLDSEKQAERTGVTALLHKPGPHVGARGESPLPDLHLFLEAKVILGWSQMFGLSLFQAQPDQFEYLWGGTHAVWRHTGKKNKQKKQQPWNKYPLCYSFRLHMIKTFLKCAHTHTHTHRVPLQVLVAPSHPCFI